MNDKICHHIVTIDNDGITVRHNHNNIYIRFDKCAENYAAENALEASKCVAVRDITTLSFTFYTIPKTKVFFKKIFLKDLISGKSAVSKFLDLQKAITRSGYTSYDLS